jgi:hypothetical protein
MPKLSIQKAVVSPDTKKVLFYAYRKRDDDYALYHLDLGFLCERNTHNSLMDNVLREVALKVDGWRSFCWLGDSETFAFVTVDSSLLNIVDPNGDINVCSFPDGIADISSVSFISTANDNARLFIDCVHSVPLVWELGTNITYELAFVRFDAWRLYFVRDDDLVLLAGKDKIALVSYETQKVHWIKDTWCDRRMAPLNTSGADSDNMRDSNTPWKISLSSDHKLFSFSYTDTCAVYDVATGCQKYAACLGRKHFNFAHKPDTRHIKGMMQNLSLKS